MRISGTVTCFPTMAAEGDVFQPAFVRTPSRDASHYLVPFGDLILNGEMEIGEGGADRSDVSLFAMKAGRLAVRGTVVDIVGGDQLVRYGHVALVVALFKPTADEGLVVFCWHGDP